MKNVFNLSLLVCLSFMLQSCFKPYVREYAFPQVGLYMSIMFEDEYECIALSRDSCLTTISQDADYLRIKPHESTCVELIIKPDCDTVYVNDSWEEALIHQVKLTFVSVKTDSTFYEKKVFPGGGQPASWVKPEYYSIVLGEHLSVVYKEIGEDKTYLVAEPFTQITKKVK